MYKRSSRERRQIGKKVSFPLTDSSGCVIPFNRSRLPERRLNNYVLTETSEEEFLLACINIALDEKRSR